MSGFNYYGFSTQNIIDEQLILVNVGSNDVNSIVGTNRVVHASDQTISRNFRNEYGTVRDLLTFNYGLAKESLQPFTTDEQLIIEDWLTYPQKSSVVEIFDCDGQVRYKYKGLFTNTTWMIPQGGNYCVCSFTFSVNGSYPFEHFKENFINLGISATWDLEVPSNPVLEKIYPTIQIIPHRETYLPSQFKITNLVNSLDKMEFAIEQCEGIKIDCQRCIIQNLNNTKVPYLSFKNFGWDDVDSIYWLYLNQGQNTIQFEGEGSVDCIVEYDLPIKKAGGWLI